MSVRTAVVLGAGKTGRACAHVLSRRGWQVTVFDTNPDSATCAVSESVRVVVCDTDVQMGEEALQCDAELYVTSPGIPPHSPALAPVLARYDVISEVELAWRIQAEDGGQQPWITVTGTNGKTTTVGMCEAILQAAGLRAFAVGNIGVSVVETVDRGDYDALVVEVSSFQLCGVRELSPTASVCLNAAADHVDWHGSVEAYRAAKARVYENTRVACVYPSSDDVVRNMVAEADVVEGARAIGFTLGHPSVSECGLVDDLLVDRAFVSNRHSEAVAVAQFSDLGGTEEHPPSATLVYDALAACALTRAVGVAPEAVAQGLASFRTAGHRFHSLGTVADVTWIDDSKATNTHAAQAAVMSVPAGRVVWIVGGDAKGQHVDSLVATVAPRLRGAIIIGEDQQLWSDAFAAHAPGVPVIGVDGHEDFMMSVAHEAVAFSLPGDTVLLAPACASWDQFDSYAQRGDCFADAVSRLERYYAAAEAPQEGK